MRGLIDTANELALRGIDAVLAVVVDTSDTSGRKRGSIGLIDSGGMLAGSLSGGGLETRLVAAARDVLASGHAEELRLDAADDDSHASSSLPESRGSIHILLLPLPAHASPLREAFVTACTGSAWLRLRLGLGAEGGDNSDLGCGEARTGSDVFTFNRHGAACPGPLIFDRHVSLTFAPPPRIALLGAGPETRALISMSRLLGWYVEVVELRAACLAYIDIEHIDRLHALAPEALPTLLAERHYDAAIVASHDFDIDARHLRHLGAVGIGYVGLLGPPERRDALLGQLGDIIATQLEPRLYAPVGLRLGGEGPESTALSIVAQLQYYLAHDVHA
jgi:xanthine dehydrogenase accessory factor